jgi:hypothetical protein
MEVESTKLGFLNKLENWVAQTACKKGTFGKKAKIRTSPQREAFSSKKVKTRSILLYLNKQVNI